MKINRSSRPRTTRRLPSPLLHLDSLESRVLLSATHPAAFLPLAQPVANTAPSKLKVALSASILNPSTSTTLTGSFADPNAADTHTLSIDWGDGSPLVTTHLAAGVTAIPATSHPYASDGIYTLTTTVTDPVNASATATSSVDVVDTFDLLPSVTKAPKLDNAVFTGATVAGSVIINIANLGSQSSPAATVSAFLRPTAGGPDINITTTPANIPAIKGITFTKGVAKHTSKPVTVNVTLPLTLTPGSYTLVIEVSDSSPNGSPAQTNNTLALPFTLNATPGTVNLSASVAVAKIPATLTQGAKASGTVSFTFSNSGNIPTLGNAFAYNVNLVLHPTSGPDVTLISKNDVGLPPIKPDGSFKISGPISLAAAATSLAPPGIYTFIATLTPVDPTTGTPLVGIPPITITEPTLTLTITAPANTGTTNLLKHGDTVKFESNQLLTGQNFLEGGSFTTNVKHISGNYEFTPTGLILTYSNGDTDTLNVTFTNTQTPLDPTVGNPGTTVFFSTDPTDAFASILALGNSTPFFAKFS